MRNSASCRMSRFCWRWVFSSRTCRSRRPRSIGTFTTARRSTFRRTRRPRKTSILRACTAAERCSATTSMTKRAASAFACRTLTARLLRHAYHASVSFVDAQVGKVLDELDRLGIAENTIVVVWGDHGWHLGDHAVWGKHTTFERSLRSVLMIRAPACLLPASRPAALVETLDIYPTLADYAGLEAPAELTGTSLRPIMDDPAHPGKDAAFGYWRGRFTMRTETLPHRQAREPRRRPRIRAVRPSQRPA